jgi:DNA-binding response OmpR family regulator
MPRSVLVVTDDPVVAAGARDCFSAEFEVEIFVDATDAGERMKKVTPALVVAEFQTGHSGGFGLIREMSLIPRLALVPTLAVIDRPQDRWLARQAGADATKVKPFTAWALAEASMELLESTSK